MGKQSNVFHVIGIEKLPEDSRIGFFRYLQRGRERFKSKPYSIVFWVTKQFEQQLFHLAPDFHHWVSGTYDFTGLKLSNELAKIQTVSKTKEQQLSFLNIRKYLEKVVWQYEHWQEIKENNEEFLIEVISRANLFDYHVPSYCIDKNNKANKVFLTCRTHYFLTEVQEAQFLKADYTILYRNYATKSNYEITRIKLRKFNEEQIKEYIFKNTKCKETTKESFVATDEDYYKYETTTCSFLNRDKDGHYKCERAILKTNIMCGGILINLSFFSF